MYTLNHQLFFVEKKIRNLREKITKNTPVATSTKTMDDAFLLFPIFIN